jgi:RND family efflux transporter MFP subunit
MRPFIYTFMRVFPALVVVTLFSSCSKKASEGQKEPSVRPVKLLTIAAADTVQSSRYPAVIDAAQMSELSFQVGGLLSALPVKETQQVQEGDLIAQLDQQDYRSQVASAQAQFDNAEEEYQRAERLSREDAIARSVLEQRKTQRDVAKAQLDSARKALADTELRAPFSGVVAKLSTEELQTIQPGQIVAILMEAGTFEAKINLPARFIAQARTREENEAYILLDVAPNRRLEATFDEATLVADATSQTYAVTFTFEPSEDLIILPGMNATVELKSSAKAEAVATTRVSVPLAAVLSDGSVQHVWVVNNETMKVSKRPVIIEEGIGDMLIVTEGLTPGEIIAGAGASG